MRTPLGIWMTDTHLSESTVNTNLSIFRQVFDLCDAIGGVKKIFHGGDCFTNRRGQSEEVLCVFKKIIDEAESRDIEFFAIPGNHDKTDLTKEQSFLDAFNGPVFHVMQAQSWLENEHIDIFFLPYFDEQLAYKEKLREVVKLVQKGKKSILLTHVGISEALTNVGIKVDNELDKSLFKAFDYVLIGHYHDRQVLEEDKIIYTGSAYQANFGENLHKGVVVIYDDPVDPLEFIDLDFKKYVTVDILPDDLDAELVGQITDKSKEANIRLRIAGDVLETKRNLVVNLQNGGTKVEIEKTSFSPTDVVQSRKIIMTDSNIVSNFDEWGKERKIKDIKYGKKLLTEAIK